MIIKTYNYNELNFERESRERVKERFNLVVLFSCLHGIVVGDPPPWSQRACVIKTSFHAHVP